MCRRSRRSDRSAAQRRSKRSRPRCTPGVGSGRCPLVVIARPRRWRCIASGPRRRWMRSGMRRIVEASASGRRRAPSWRGGSEQMSDVRGRIVVYEELLRRFASGTRAAQLYAADHPLIGWNVEGLLGALRTLHQHLPVVTIGIVDQEFVVADTPLAKASGGMRDLIDRLLINKVERLSFERGVTPEEIVDLMLGLAKLSTKGGDAAPAWNFPHIRVGRITLEEPGKGGIASDMAAIRQLYSTAVSAAEAVWE